MHIATVARKRTDWKGNKEGGQFDQAAIAQLGERQTEDLKVPGSIPGLGMLFCRNRY